MGQVYGAGGKTVPKKGRLGTGSYWPEGTPMFTRRGNTFPGIVVTRKDHNQNVFGRDPSRAGIATVVGQNRTSTPPIMPLHPQYNLSTQVKAPAMVVSSSNEQNNLQPVAPANSVLSMPHERNTNSASGSKKKPHTYRTVFGASRTMPTDTAFQNDPNAMYLHTTRQRPNPTKEAVKVSATSRSFVRPANPLPVSGGMQDSGQQHRTPPASFVSRNNQWNDPHNSFQGGHSTLAGPGVGRWQIVKHGVISGIVPAVRSGGKPS